MVLPTIVLAGIYTAATNSIAWLILATTPVWAWFWTFADDSENIRLTAWVLAILTTLSGISILLGNQLIDPEVRQRIWAEQESQTQNSASQPATRSETPQAPKPPPTQYKNPMGGVWPSQSGLIAGRFSAKPCGGALEIDNRAGQSAIYLKLCASSSAPCPGLRHVYVAQSDQFIAAGLPSGFYHVRYVETQATDAVRWAKRAAFEIRSGRAVKVKLPTRPGIAMDVRPVVAIAPINRAVFR